jgi:hypothetical protein
MHFSAQWKSSAIPPYIESPLQWDLDPNTAVLLLPALMLHVDMASIQLCQWHVRLNYAQN